MTRLDTDYFGRKLAIIVRDLSCYTPQEMARELVRLAKVADENEAAKEAAQSVRDAAQPGTSLSVDGAVAELDAFEAALEAEFPIPDSPHMSVKQYAIDNRKAFLKGWDACLAQPTTAPEEVRDTCKWALTDEDNGIWESACGEAWSFVDGGPKENRVTFCHHCGKRAAIATTTPKQGDA